MRAFHWENFTALTRQFSPDQRRAASIAAVTHALHDVVLAFEPHLAGVARASLAAARDIILIGCLLYTSRCV